MKLKYYLRGMGIGIILTAIVMGFALGGRKATMSDAEVIQRAKTLGMIEADSGVLTDTAEGVNVSNENDTSSSDKALAEEGGPVFEEIQPEVAGSDSSVSSVSGEKEETKDESTAPGKSSSTTEVQTEEQTEEQDVVIQDNAQSSTSGGDTKKTEEASELTSSDSSATASSEQSTQLQESALGEELSEFNNDSSANENSSEPAQPQVPSKTVTIPGGTSSDGVAEILYREGFVDNAVNFNRFLIETGKDRIIRSGVKTIPEGASYEEIASIITKG